MQQYKNKCIILEKNNFQFKSKLRKIKQEKDLLSITTNNINKNNINNNEIKNKKDYKDIQIYNKQYIIYESNNIKSNLNKNEERNYNLNNNSKIIDEIKK